MTQMEEETTPSPLPNALKSGAEGEPTPADTVAPTDNADTAASDAKPQLDDVDTRGNPPVIQYGRSPFSEMVNPVLDFKPAKAGSFAPIERLAVMGVTAQEANNLSDFYPELELGETDHELNWGALSEEAAMHAQVHGHFEEATRRPNSMWRNSVRAENENLHLARPKFEKSEGQQLSGQAAVMRMQALVGLGSHARVPLWYTGLWVTMRAPTEAALLELERRLAHEKVTFGRQSGGLAYSNSMSYLMNHLVDFALAHVIEATCKYSETAELKDIILQPDAEALIHGLLCTMYPNGYPYRQPCVINPSKCTHVIEALISLPRLAWTDQMRLTAWQGRQMTRKTAKFTAEEIKRYQGEHALLDSRNVTLSDSVSMTLTIPTIAKYVEVGTSWIDSIVEKIERTFGKTASPQERAKLINDHARITSLCQYAHWVEKLVLKEADESTATIVDPSAIMETLAVMAGATDVSSSFYEGIRKFIDDSALTVFAVPKTPCPKCSPNDQPIEPEDSRHPYLIPLDLVNVFSTLRARRIIKIIGQG